MATIVTKPGNTAKPYTVRYTDPTTCKQHEKSFKLKKDATDFKVKFEHDSRDSIFIDPSLGKIDFITYVGEWIAAHQCSAGTRTGYRSVLNARIKPAFEGRTLASVANDRDGVASFIADLDCSASRKVTALTVMVQSVKAAKLSKKISHHTLEGLTVKSDAAKPAEIIPASAEQLDTLRAGLGADALLIDLMRGAGLRISEALAVNVAGFRSNGKVLRVSEQVLPSGELGPLKHRKTGEYRDVPVPAWLWLKVQEHQAGADGYLFGRNGKHVTYKQVAGRFATAAGKAGLKIVKRGKISLMTPHHLRHLYVSRLLNHGVPITDVAEFVGHRNINVTYAVYGHLMPSAWDRASDALESLAA